MNGTSSVHGGIRNSVRIALALAAAALLGGPSAHAGSLTVDGAAAMNGTTKGLEAIITDTTSLYVEDDTPNAESHYHGKFYFNPNTFDPGEAQSHFRTRIFIGFTNPASPRRIFAVVLKRQGGAYSLEGRVRQNDNSQNDTGFFAINAGPHLVEWDFTKATTGNSNGTFQFYIDGALKNTLNANTNDASAVDQVRMGALSVKTGASGSMYFDEFASTR